MATPWLSVVIPTIGRAELCLTLDSIDAQVNHGSVEVLVVADTHSGVTPALDAARTLVEQRDERYRWIEHDGGTHCYGQPQRQFGMGQAAGQWIAFSADDNIMTPNAIASIWQVLQQIGEPRPLLFRVRTWQAGVVWRRQMIELGNIDADCIVVPNEQDKLGEWTNVYEGDFHFISETASRYGGRVHWRDDLLAVARPQSHELWWKTPNPVRLFAPRHVSV